MNKREFDWSLDHNKIHLSYCQITEELWKLFEKQTTDEGKAEVRAAIERLHDCLFYDVLACKRK